ncbi:unnamed protein product [Ixodes pacificus]
MPLEHLGANSRRQDEKRRASLNAQPPASTCRLFSCFVCACIVEAPPCNSCCPTFGPRGTPQVGKKKHAIVYSTPVHDSGNMLDIVPNGMRMYGHVLQILGLELVLK